MSEILEIILYIFTVPWWLWALFIGVSGLFIGVSLGSFPIAGLGGISLTIGIVGALRKAS